jgi:hypothetical protein
MTGKREGPDFLRLSRAAPLLLSLFCTAGSTWGYSVLTHEAIIDAEWEDQIRPLLIERFPNATPEQLRQAQAYAYGGCVIQDLGYYPFASRFFSHLMHYVRSGDFVEALFEESRDINDYAFALGALSHYVADIQGHSLAVNRAVPLLYPELRRKYGDWMTWEDSPWAHALTEFGFDTVEVVAGHVAPQKYHDWIGFRVPKPVLERAFERTYGLELKNQILRVNFAIFSYDELASNIIPEMTEVAWVLRRKELEERASALQHKRLYHLPHKSYAAWEKTRSKPGAGDKLTAFIFRLIPKFGPLNAFDFHAPTVHTEQLFADSLKATVQSYEPQLRAAQAGRFDPPNVDLDTGRPTQPGEYVHCDQTYAELLHRLQATRFAHVTPELRDNVITFYEEPADNVVRNHHKRWRRVLRDLDELKATRGLPETAQLTGQ